MFNFLGGSIAELLFAPMKFAFGLSFGGDDEESTSTPAAPTYQASKYDAPASESIYNFYSPRLKGENLGFAPEDLSLMKGEAIDTSTHGFNETMRRGMAGRQLTGGLTQGGVNTLRENALSTGLQARSNAVRDIGIRNAVLKQQQQWQAASGMQNFLGAERANAGNVFQMQYAPWQYQDQKSMYNNLYNNQSGSDLWGGLGELGGGLLGMFGSDSSAKPTETAGNA